MSMLCPCISAPLGAQPLPIAHTAQTQSLYDRISTSRGTVRGSAFPAERAVGGGGRSAETGWSAQGESVSSRWEDGRYRTPTERAEREANPDYWGVLLAAGALARQSGTGTSAGGWSDAGESSTVKRRSSRATSLRARSQSRERKEQRKRARTVTESTLAEEPESYSATDVYGIEEEDASGRSAPRAAGEADEEDQLPSDEGDEADGADDSDSDSDSPLLHPAPPPSLDSPGILARTYRRVFPLSPLVRNVLKCVLSYYLAELFTFVPILSDLTGAPWDQDSPLRNAHVIASVAVYFMPARSIGGMLEADAFLLVGVTYAAFLSCGSMGMMVLFERLDLLRLGHAFVLIFWLGCGYGLVAYVKVVMGKPSLSTACSLVSLICSGIITKEGAFLGQFRTRAVEQVLLIAGIGSLISNVICFLVWPQSATDKLQADLNKTLSSFGTLVEMLTKTFLLDTDFSVRPADLKKSIDAHQSSFTTLKTSLSQAKWEVFDSRIAGPSITKAYDAAVESMTRLAQGLTGMRAGCALQWEIMKAREEGRLKFPAEEAEGGARKGEKQVLWDEMVVLERFKEHVGPSLQSLSQTSVSILQLLRTSFVRTKAGSATRRALSDDDPEAALLPAEGLISLKQELEGVLALFKREHSRAVKILYRSLPAQTIYGGDALDSTADPFANPSNAEQQQQDSGPNDNLFRIYHFCFNLEEWATELLHLVSIFISLRETEEAVERQAVERTKKWGVLAPVVKVIGSVFFGRKEGKATQLGRQFARALKTPRKKYHSAFPEIVDGALSSHQVEATAATHSLVARLKLAFWHFGWHLRQPNVRFAIKTGAGVAVLSSAAFIPQLRPIWLEWRGEWSLISYFVVCAPALGDSNFLAAGRILGTAVGAVVAVACYSAFPENPYVLPLLGALFSAPCFYVAITRPQYAPSSRFVLLTFNLTCLYSFNIRETDTHVVSTAFHRFVAVVVGVLWGLFINTYVWPFEARRELRKGLSEFFLNASYLYERLVRIYSAPPPSLSRTGTIRRRPNSDDLGERTSLLPKEAKLELAAAAEDFVAMEIELQLLLIKVSGLLAATRHEPRLKGPFPVDAYRAILASCQSILDSLTAVARMTNREAWFATIRRDFVIPVNKERREMVGNIILYFSILSSAVSLKTPLPAYLPPAAEARERLVAKLRELEIVKRRLVRGGSESLLYYAYTTTVRDVISQLDELGRSFQQLFGVIGGYAVEDFEALFRDEPDNDGALSSEEDSDASGQRQTGRA
ncbi:hypothetical protein JCM6882_005029 [Rhodosporidiobolus microsporus]